MYSVVLVMALTTGGEVADFGRKGGCCGGCYGGCYGGCGGGGGLFHGRRHGCHGCYGGCYGGGCYGGCYGGGYGGCYGGCGGGVPAPMPHPQPMLNPQPLPPQHHAGCHGGHPHHGLVVGGSCYGGTILSITPSPEKKKEEKKDKKDKKEQEEVNAASEASAKVVVSLPADARLKIDGQDTTSTGSERTFVSPKLVKGEKYSWTLEVELRHDDKPVIWTQKVSLTPGETQRVSLTVPISARTK
jgi:uncharacterized protein (TIGR03000 family)